MGQRKCKCPIWVNGRVRGEIVRKSLKTRNWETALRIARKWEDKGEEKALGFSVFEACDRFYADCVAQRLSNSFLRKYNLLCNELKVKTPEENTAYLSCLNARLFLSIPYSTPLPQ